MCTLVAQIRMPEVGSGYGGAVKWGGFRRPSVAVDVAVLTVVPGREPWLGLLRNKRAGDAYKDRWDIPGGFRRPAKPSRMPCCGLLRERVRCARPPPTEARVSMIPTVTSAGG